MKYLKYSFLFSSLFFYLACQSESSTGREVSKNSPIPKIESNSEAKPKAVESMPLLPKTHQAQSGKLLPVDEGQLSPDFQRFRKELLQAINRKDVQFIDQVLAENIKIDFGGGSGKSAFAEKWNLEDPDARFWQICKKILHLGGTFDRQNKNGFMVPYLSGTWPDLDPFEYGVVTGKDVRVRENPTLDGIIVGALSYDVVRLGALTEEAPTSVLEGEEWPWVKIEMPDKSGMGYVYGKYIHGPVDYRAYFERINGQWKMLSFLDGD